MRVAAVVFDMDGVILDTEGIEHQAEIRVRKEMGLPEDPELHQRGRGIPYESWLELHRESCGPRFEEFFEHMEQVHQRLHLDAPLKPGVHQLMDYLKTLGYMVGVATATPQALADQALRRTGVAPYLDALVCGDTVPRNKPAPDIYLEACRQLGVAPELALAIEDSPNGLRAAHGAGMLPVMVPDMVPCTPEVEPLLFAQADSLLDVLELVQFLEQPEQEPMGE